MSYRLITVFALASLTGCHSRPAPPPTPRAPALPASKPAVADQVAGPEADPFVGDSAARLDAWYTAVGPRRPGESFDALVIRAAKTQLGRPYFNPPHEGSNERLRIRLDTFQCVSFVETTLALARCVWSDRATHACFVSEVAASRYRNGRVHGYDSRLHYFSDWLLNNAARRRIRLATTALGGRPVRAHFFYITRHPRAYPALANPLNVIAIAADEKRLSHTTFAIIDRRHIARDEHRLQNGDVIALVGSHPGMLVAHAAFVSRGADGIPRLLHASSFHHRVLLTRGDIAGYVLRRPERRGIMVAQPLPPPSSRAALRP